MFHYQNLVINLILIAKYYFEVCHFTKVMNIFISPVFKLFNGRFADYSKFFQYTEFTSSYSSEWVTWPIFIISLLRVAKLYFLAQ